MPSLGLYSPSPVTYINLITTTSPGMRITRRISYLKIGIGIIGVLFPLATLSENMDEYQL